MATVAPELVSMLPSFGAAGLIAWMWLTERRAAAARDSQQTALAERLVQERTELRVLVSIITENTRALSALEAAQRDAASSLRRIAEHLDARDRAAGEVHSKP